MSHFLSPHTRYNPILFYELIEGRVFSNLSTEAKKKGDKPVKLVSSTR
jgi:hypothetical protein